MAYIQEVASCPEVTEVAKDDNPLALEKNDYLFGTTLALGEKFEK